MITRIVKMKFKVDGIDTFIEFINSRVDTIRAFEGCEGLKILRDERDPSIIFTYSLWKNDQSLQAYRSSEFFKETWKVTKSFFMDKPEAWSLDVLHDT